MQVVDESKNQEDWESPKDACAICQKETPVGDLQEASKVFELEGTHEALNYLKQYHRDMYSRYQAAIDSNSVICSKGGVSCAYGLLSCHKMVISFQAIDSEFCRYEPGDELSLDVVVIPQILSHLEGVRYAYTPLINSPFLLKMGHHRLFPYAFLLAGLQVALNNFILRSIIGFWSVALNLPCIPVLICEIAKNDRSIFLQCFWTFEYLFLSGTVLCLYSILTRVYSEYDIELYSESNSFRALSILNLWTVYVPSLLGVGFVLDSKVTLPKTVKIAILIMISLTFCLLWIQVFLGKLVPTDFSLLCVNDVCANARTLSLSLISTLVAFMVKNTVGSYKDIATSMKTDVSVYTLASTDETHIPRNTWAYMIGDSTHDRARPLSFNVLDSSKNGRGESNLNNTKRVVAFESHN